MYINQIVLYSQTLYIFYMFTVNKVLIHFKIFFVFAFILQIYLNLSKAANLYPLFTVIFY